jgi:glycosyltransferase involved in cell wall biosynthesis
MSRRLRVLVAHNVLNNRTGGMSRLMGFIHDRVERDGHAVDYFGAEQVPSRWPSRLSRFTFPWLLWRHLVAANKSGRPYDIVNIHEPSAAFVAMRKSAAGNPRLVITSHGIEDRGWQVSLEDARLGRVPLSRKTRIWHSLTLRTQAHIGLRRADHVFCLNEEDREFLLCKYTLTPEQVTRVFPAADPIYAQAYPRRTYDIADRLLFFGTWLARKGTPDLIPAFVTLANRHPHLKLTVIGAGFSAETVLGSFPDYLRARVEVIPPGTAEEYAERMLGAAAFILPSVFEGTPLTLMESMATGLPVVATATCGMKDVIDDDVNGILVPVRDPAALVMAIDRLLADRHLRERLGRQAYADVAARYTWDRVAEPVRDVYRKLAGNHR